MYDAWVFEYYVVRNKLGIYVRIYVGYPQVLNKFGIDIILMIIFKLITTKKNQSNQSRSFSDLVKVDLI